MWDLYLKVLPRTGVVAPIQKGTIDRMEAVQRYFARRFITEGLHHFLYTEMLT